MPVRVLNYTIAIVYAGVAVVGKQHSLQWVTVVLLTCDYLSGLSASLAIYRCDWRYSFHHPRRRHLQRKPCKCFYAHMLTTVATYT